MRLANRSLFDSSQRAEEPVAFTVDPRGEEQAVGRPGLQAVAESERVEGDPPGIDQVRVGELGHPGDVRDQVGLQVAGDWLPCIDVVVDGEFVGGRQQGAILKPLDERSAA